MRAASANSVSAKKNKKLTLAPLPYKKHAQEVWAHPKARPRDQKKQNSTYHHDDGSETASDADRPAGRSLRKTPSSE